MPSIHILEDAVLADNRLKHVWILRVLALINDNIVLDTYGLLNLLDMLLTYLILCTLVANAEKPLDAGTNYYVPRDEAFHEVKQESFIMNVLKGAVHQMVPLVTSSFKQDCDDFHCFHAIDQLYQEGIKLRNFQNEENGILKGLPMSRTIKNFEDSANQVSDVLQFAEPSILSSKINTTLFKMQIIQYNVAPKITLYTLWRS